MSQTTDLLALMPDELESFMKSIGEPAYRAGQLFSQMHRGISPDRMTNIGKATLEKMRAVTFTCPPSAGSWFPPLTAR